MEIVALSHGSEMVLKIVKIKHMDVILLAMIMMVEIVVQAVQQVALLEAQQVALHHAKIVSLTGLRMAQSVAIQHGMSMELTVQH
tara:strand:- start:197 stop:451 length:255 start_codon:yes stop_codon:yes gene_type:complete